MTVSSTSSRANYVGNGSNMAFPFAFKVNQPADLVVVYTDAAGIDYTLSPSQYAATGFGVDAGGSVTYPLAGSPIASGTRLTIYRDVAVTQPTSLSNQGAMWPQVIEAALDRLTYIAQKVTDSVSRSLVISPTDSASLNVLPNATQRANGYLGFDGNGQPAVIVGAPGTTPVSTAMAPVLNQGTLASARTTMGVAGIADGNAFGGINTFTNTVDISTGSGRLLTKTRNAGDKGTDAATTAFVATAIAFALRSYLAELGTANNATTPNSKIDVAAGVCTDDTNAALLAYGGGSLDCTTIGANGLDVGSLANSTWYHLFMIAQSGGANPALLASLKSGGLDGNPSLPTGYTLKRRIGSFKTDGSAHIIAFSQNGDEFLWKAPPIDQSGATLSTTSTLYTVSVPLGVQTNALFTGSATAGGNASVVFQSPSQNTLAVTGQGPGSDSIVVTGTSGNGAGGRFNIRTDTNRQIRAVASTTVTLAIFTHGWIDRRGRDS